MGYIYETHCHTCETSKCGVTNGATYARYYKALGYSGFFITDHFWGSNVVDMPDDWTWKQKVDRFCLGYDNAKAEGDKIGINVMFGWEFGVGWTHLLTYGLDKYWLYENPDVVGLGLKQYADKIHEAGGYIVHAHPFREDNPVMTFIPNDTDAVEVINGARPDKNNVRGNLYAEMLELPKTAGSDIHNVKTKRDLAGVISEAPILTPTDYIEQLKNRSLKVFAHPNEHDIVEYEPFIV